MTVVLVVVLILCGASVEQRPDGTQVELRADPCLVTAWVSAERSPASPDSIDLACFGL